MIVEQRARGRRGSVLSESGAEGAPLRVADMLTEKM